MTLSTCIWCKFNSKVFFWCCLQYYACNVMMLDRCKGDLCIIFFVTNMILHRVHIKKSDKKRSLHCKIDAPCCVFCFLVCRTSLIFFKKHWEMTLIAMLEPCIILVKVVKCSHEFPLESKVLKDKFLRDDTTAFVFFLIHT